MRKREKKVIQITDMMNERSGITRDSSDVKMITRYYYDQLYA